MKKKHNILVYLRSTKKPVVFEDVTKANYDNLIKHLQSADTWCVAMGDITIAIDDISRIIFK